MPGTITFKPIEANLTHNTNFIKKMNSYCSISVGDHKVRGQVCKRGGKHPHWNDSISLSIGQESHAVVHVIDKDRITHDDHIGNFIMDLREVQRYGHVKQWYPLYHKNKDAGDIFLEVDFQAEEPIQTIHQQEVPQVIYKEQIKPQAQVFTEQKQIVEPHTFVKEVEVVESIPAIKKIPIYQQEAPQVIYKEQIKPQAQVFTEQKQIIEPHTFVKEVEVVENIPVIKEIEIMKPIKVIKDVQVTEAVPVKKHIEVTEPHVVMKEVEVMEPRVVTKTIHVVENVPVIKQVEAVEMKNIVKEIETVEPQTFTKAVEVTEYVPTKKEVEISEPVRVKKVVRFEEPVITTQTVTKEVQEPVIVGEKITRIVGPASVVGVEIEKMNRESEILENEFDNAQGLWKLEKNMFIAKDQDRTIQKSPEKRQEIVDDLI